jgi:hypothetical protein
MPDPFTEFPRTRDVLEEGRLSGLHPGAQIYVSRDRHPLLDAALGEASPGHPMRPDTLTLWMSSSNFVRFSTCATVLMGALKTMNRARHGALLAAVLLIGATGCQAPAVKPTATFHSSRLSEMDTAVTRAIDHRRLPGGVLWFEREGARHHKAYGNRAVVPAVEPMTTATWSAACPPENTRYSSPCTSCTR